MAAVATPARQPFGLLNETKLRNLQSVKNCQNGITPSSAPSLKRRHASPELSDSENVDPNMFESVKKRKHHSTENDVSMEKPHRYSLTTVPSVKAPLSIPTTTPLLTAAIKSTTTPASAPAAAGRSPVKSRPNGILSTRRRFAPPSFGNNKSPSLSITAALNGTLAARKSKHKARTLDESKPKSWFFDIYEESQEQQDYTISEGNMTRSAISLDISDDEGKSQSEDRGKENVDPNEISPPMTRSMTVAAKASRITRKDMMTDEPRTPLGDLDVTEYYAEGLDATSVVLVHDDENTVSESDAVKEEVVQDAFKLDSAVTETTAFTFDAAATSTCEKMSSAEVGALLMASAPVWETETLLDSPPSLLPSTTDTEADGIIEIWESESAKDENEEREQELDKENITGDMFALAEL